MVGIAFPNARSYLHSSTGDPPDPHRSTSDRGSEVLRGGSGGGRGTVWGRVGAIGGQRLDQLGRQAGFGGGAETRGTGKGPEPGHPLTPDPSAESPLTIPPETAKNRHLREFSPTP